MTQFKLFKLKGERIGKRLNRDDFDYENSSRDFQATVSNRDFLKVLEDMGITVAKKNDKQKKRKEDNQVVVGPVGMSQPTPLNHIVGQEFSILKDKYVGQYLLEINKISDSPTSMKTREINFKWVKKIKDDILTKPSPPVTVIPVVCKTEINYEVRENISEAEFYCLGGNHLLTALHQIINEEVSNEEYDCLKYINADVYRELSVMEALFVSSWHNQKCEGRQLTLQEKIRIARRSYEINNDNWKNQALLTLGYITGKTKKIDSIGTILSVASYNTSNYKLVQEIFTSYDEEESFPQKLFKQLQGVNEEMRAVYLSKAIGSNGLKVSRMINDDRRRETMKSIAEKVLNDEWQVLEETLLNSNKLLEYSGDINTPEGRKRYQKYITETCQEPENSVVVDIVIKYGGKDITDRYCQVIKKFERKIQKSIKIDHFDEE